MIALPRLFASREERLARRAAGPRVGAEPFAQILADLMQRDGRSRRAIAIAAGIDPSYLSRLRSGDRAPTPLVARQLERALRHTSSSDRRWLVTAAGVLPVPAWDAALDDVAAALAVLDDPEAQLLRATIHAVCELALASLGSSLEAAPATPLAVHVGGRSP